MPNWPAFAGITGVVLAVLLVLARLSEAALDDAGSAGDREAKPTDRRAADGPATAGGPRTADGRTTADDPPPGPAADARRPEPPADPLPDPPVGPDGREWGTGGAPERGGDPEAAQSTPGAELSTGVLLANVAVSQGLLGTLLLAGAWYAAVPPAALGAGPAGVDPAAVAAGLGLGAALYAANEVGAAVGRHVGIGGGEELRAALAPETAGGWAVLLLVVLPVIAGFEELLFRGALIGATSAGFGLSPWPLAVGSSVAFAAGHGAQGRVGMAVTGTLGFVLAAAFVLTGSLLTVVVAHYLVNALEFLVHEWAGIDPSDRLRPPDG